jgi:hypothetical protein
MTTRLRFHTMKVAYVSDEMTENHFLQVQRPGDRNFPPVVVALRGSGQAQPHPSHSPLSESPRRCPHVPDERRSLIHRGHLLGTFSSTGETGSFILTFLTTWILNLRVLGHLFWRPSAGATISFVELVRSLNQIAFGCAYWESRCPDSCPCDHRESLWTRQLLQNLDFDSHEIIR